MAAFSLDHADEASAALRAIVSDPAHGPDALDDSQTTANLLQDLLPDAPRETGLLIAATAAGLPAMLRGHVAQGMDLATAASLAAAALSGRTAFTPEACRWAATELAIALGLAPARQRPAIEPRPPRTEPAAPALTSSEDDDATQQAARDGHYPASAEGPPPPAAEAPPGTAGTPPPGPAAAGPGAWAAPAAVLARRRASAPVLVAAAIVVAGGVIAAAIWLARPAGHGVGAGVSEPPATTPAHRTAGPSSSPASPGTTPATPGPYHPAAAPVLSVGAPFGQALPGTARVAVPPAVSGGAVNGCPYSDACMYTVSGWYTGHSEHEYFNYDCYNLGNEYGTRVIANNQYGGATIIAYKHYNCAGPAWMIPGAYYAMVDITPINSVSLNP